MSGDGGSGGSGGGVGVGPSGEAGVVDAAIGVSPEAAAVSISSDPSISSVIANLAQQMTQPNIAAMFAPPPVGLIGMVANAFGATHSDEGQSDPSQSADAPGVGPGPGGGGGNPPLAAPAAPAPVVAAPLVGPAVPAAPVIDFAAVQRERAAAAAAAEAERRRIEAETAKKEEESRRRAKTETEPLRQLSSPAKSRFTTTPLGLAGDFNFTGARAVALGG